MKMLLQFLWELLSSRTAIGLYVLIVLALILWLVMNSIWFNRRRNYLIISLLMWSVLILLFLSVWFLTDRILWLVFLLGLPGQAIIIMWSHLKQKGE